MVRREREIKKEREEGRQEKREQRSEKRPGGSKKTHFPQGRPRGSLSRSKTSQKLAFHEASVSQLSPI